MRARLNLPTMAATGAHGHGVLNLRSVYSAVAQTFLLLLQTLVFLAISGGLVLAAGGAALVAKQQRRSASA